jgi:hypothetical protein
MRLVQAGVEGRDCKIKKGLQWGRMSIVESEMEFKDWRSEMFDTRDENRRPFLWR